MADENIINKIMSEYENLRIAAATERKRRIKEVNSKFPRIAEIDKEIFSLGSKNMKDILKNPEKSAELNESFKKNLTRLNDEKNKIIFENHIDPDYDKYKYLCSNCNDTGYTENGEKCQCFKQRLIDEAYSMSNMSEMIKEQNFDTFSLDYYSPERDETGLSPRENMVKILSGCKSFCENFDNENKSLLFYGSVGLGKTFLSSAIAKEIMDSGKTVLYIRSTRLCIIYRDYSIGKNIDKNTIENIYNSDLLIIDDLGTEFDNEFNKSFLLDVINERIIRNKKIVMSTNLSIGELAQRYTTRFTSRLYEYFNIYKFYGDDARLQKLKNR